ncbi:hypothetical protein B296_00040664, partial [Ensete ventricosum]
MQLRKGKTKEKDTKFSAFCTSASSSRRWRRADRAPPKPPVCARSPASQSLRHRVELVRMSGDSGLGLGGLMLEWGSPGEEGVVPLGSAA